MRRPMPHVRRLFAVPAGWRPLAAAALLGAFAVSAGSPAWSQPAGRPMADRADEAGPRWSELSGAERAALKPLEREWSTLPPDSKKSWLDIASRVPSMSPAERSRVQGRMTEWARMSPQQRSRARLAFQEAKEVSPQDRRAQWEAYQALSPEQKRQLQSRAVPPAPPRSGRTARSQEADEPQRKSNIVPNPAYAARPKPVAPTVVQAQPGATTTLMSKRPAPPAHQQTGMPKITATPGFVDKSTLLPQRGPQGAAAARSPGSGPSRRR